MQTTAAEACTEVTPLSRQGWVFSCRSQPSRRSKPMVQMPRCAFFYIAIQMYFNLYRPNLGQACESPFVHLRIIFSIFASSDQSRFVCHPRSKRRVPLTGRIFIHYEACTTRSRRNAIAPPAAPLHTAQSASLCRDSHRIRQRGLIHQGQGEEALEGADK